MKKRFNSLTTLALAGAMGFAGPGFAQVKEIKIGYLLPMSADSAPQGQQSKRAVDMAVEEINGAGGIKALGGAKLKIVYADTQSKPQVAVQEAERLIAQEKVEFLAGAYNSGVTLPASEVAERYKKVWWVPVSSDDSITNRPNFKYVFRLAEKTSMRIAAQLDFIQTMAKESNSPVKTVALVFETRATGRVLPCNGASSFPRTAGKSSWTSPLTPRPATPRLWSPR